LDKESSFEKKNTKECFDAARENQLWLEGTSSASTVVFLAMSRGFILLVQLISAYGCRCMEKLPLDQKLMERRTQYKIKKKEIN